MIRLLIILLALLFPVSVCHSLEVEFLQSADVDGVTITLGDIASFDEDSDITRALASQTVAQSPPPGQNITIDTQAVRQHLVATFSLSPAISWSGSATVTVNRNAIQIGAGQISEIIDNYLQGHRHELPESEIRFIPATLPLPFLIPAGEVTWEVIPSNPAIIGSNRFAIIFRVDDRVRKNMSVRGHLEVLSPVAVAATSLRKGTVLSPNHLVMTIKDISELREPCLDLTDVIGKRLKRSLKGGATLSLSSVEFPPLIRRGELVKIVVQHGSLRLTATGVARSDGKMDQMIRVKNTSSNKVIYCRVTAPGLVEVTL